MTKQQVRVSKELRRQKRVRKTVVGSAEKPRLSVYRSTKHIYAQLIDDAVGRTLAACSTLSKDLPDLKTEKKTKTEVAKVIGEALGKKALELGFKVVVFDRNRYRYHGRVKAIAEGARKAGLEF
ncbi:MAG: 50S ribosomal protein L18 [bacterium]